MGSDTDSQGADAHLDNDPLLQAAINNTDTGVDGSTPPATGGAAYSQDDQLGEDGQPDKPAETPPEPPQQPVHQVPLSELLNTRERAQRAERELEELRRWRQEQERQKQAPDFYTDPQKAAQHEALSAIQQHIAPVLQQLQAARLDDARAIAQQIHGDVATKAEEAFNEAARTGRIDPAEHARINNSPNPFRAAVEWFKRNQVLSEVGDDPAKYREKVLEDALKDERYLAKAIEAAQARAAGNLSTGQRPPPSNVTRLPSVARTGSAAGITPTQEADLTDQEVLDRWADPPRRRG